MKAQEHGAEHEHRGGAHGHDDDDAGGADASCRRRRVDHEHARAVHRLHVATRARLALVLGRPRTLKARQIAHFTHRFDDHIGLFIITTSEHYVHFEINLLVAVAADRLSLIRSVKVRRTLFVTKIVQEELLWLAFCRSQKRNIKLDTNVQTRDG